MARVPDAVLSDIARNDTNAGAKLARAIEIFLRTNGCFARTEAVDGKFLAAEGRVERASWILIPFSCGRPMAVASDPEEINFGEPR